MSETADTAQVGREWPGAIGAITLFFEDLAEARRFSLEVFRLPVAFEDGDSAVFRFGETLVKLLRSSEAPELVAPAPGAAPGGGVRFQFTLEVDDLDATCRELEARGVELSNGPVDRPWGSARRASATRAAMSGRSRTRTASRKRALLR